MTHPMPLNGPGVTKAVVAALRGQATYTPPPRPELDPIQQALVGLPEEETIDGIGAATKSESTESRPRAVDPSQGRGATSSRTPRDPLVEALSRIGSRRR